MKIISYFLLREISMISGRVGLDFYSKEFIKSNKRLGSRQLIMNERSRNQIENIQDT